MPLEPTTLADFLERVRTDPDLMHKVIGDLLGPTTFHGRLGDRYAESKVLLPRTLPTTAVVDPPTTMTVDTVTVRIDQAGTLSLPNAADVEVVLKAARADLEARISQLSDAMTVQANMHMLQRMHAMLPIGGPPPPSWPEPQTIGAGPLRDPAALRQYRQELLRQYGGTPDPRPIWHAQYGPPMTGVPMPSLPRFSDGVVSPYDPAFRDFMAAAGCGPTCTVGTHFDIEQLETVYFHSSGPGSVPRTLRMPDILQVAPVDQAEYILRWLRALHDGSTCDLCGELRDPDAEPIVLEVPEPDITVKLNGQLFEYRNGHVSPYPIQTQVEACSRPCATAYAMKLDMRRPPPRAHLDPERRRAREEARDAALEQLASRDSEPVVDTPLWDIWRDITQ